MKRLLAQTGLISFSVLAVAFYLPETVTLILLCVSAAACAVLFAVKKTRQKIAIPLAALTVAAACAVNIGYTYLHVIPLQERFSGTDRRVEATLTDESYCSYSRYYYRVRVDAVDGEDANFKLLLRTSAPIDAEPYDSVVFKADISKTDNRYYLAKGYYLSVDTYEPISEVIEPQSRPLGYQVIRWRRVLRSALDRYLPDDAADLCKAVFIGDKYALDSEIKTDFRYAGASYLIVVSGMHFSIICLLIFRLLNRMRVNRGIACAVTLAVILLYMLVTGFQPSVVRSGVMMIVYIFGHVLRRIGDPHSSLGLAGIVSIIVFSPLGAGDIGLILSFAATFAIVTWADPIYRRIRFKDPATRLKRFVNKILQVISMSLAANLLVFPISVYVFGAFSTVTLISALVLYLPIQWILILTLAVCLFYIAGPLRFLSLLLSWPLYLLCRPVLWFVHWIASLPFAYITVNHTYFYVWLTVSLVLAFVTLMLRHRIRLWTFTVLLSLLLLIGGTVVNAAVRLNTVKLTAFSCGEGMTVALDYHGQLFLLSFQAGASDAERIAEQLSRDYTEAQLAVCSQKRDYRNYARLSVGEFAIHHCLLYDSSIEFAGTELIPYDTAECYLLADDVDLTVDGCDGRLIGCLTVGDTTVSIIPSGYPDNEIPTFCRSSDIIVLSKPPGDGAALSCDTLIISNTSDNASVIASAMKDRCRTVLITDGEDISIRLG